MASQKYEQSLFVQSLKLGGRMERETHHWGALNASQDSTWIAISTWAHDCLTKSEASFEKQSQILDI